MSTSNNAGFFFGVKAADASPSNAAPDVSSTSAIATPSKPAFTGFSFSAKAEAKAPVIPGRESSLTTAAAFAELFNMDEDEHEDIQEEMNKCSKAWDDAKTPLEFSISDSSSILERLMQPLGIRYQKEEYNDALLKVIGQSGTLRKSTFIEWYIRHLFDNTIETDDEEDDDNEDENSSGNVLKSAASWNFRVPVEGESRRCEGCRVINDWAEVQCIACDKQLVPLPAASAKVVSPNKVEPLVKQLSSPMSSSFSSPVPPPAAVQNNYKAESAVIPTEVVNALLGKVSIAEEKSTSEKIITEDKVLSTSAPAAAASEQLLDVGCYVALSSDYLLHDDASRGPLRPGDIAIIEENDKSDKPYRIRVITGVYVGAFWWYNSLALVRIESPRVGNINDTSNMNPALKFSYGYPTMTNDSGYQLPMMLPQYAGGELFSSNHSIKPILGLDMSGLPISNIAGGNYFSPPNIAGSISTEDTNSNIVYLPCLVMLPFVMTPSPVVQPKASTNQVANLVEATNATTIDSSISSAHNFQAANTTNSASLNSMSSAASPLSPQSSQSNATHHSTPAAVSTLDKLLSNATPHSSSPIKTPATAFLTAAYKSIIGESPVPSFSLDAASSNISFKANGTDAKFATPGLSLPAQALPATTITTTPSTSLVGNIAAAAAPPPPFPLKAPAKVAGVAALDSTKATTAASMPPFSIKDPSATAAAPASSSSSSSSDKAAGVLSTQTAPPPPFSLKAPSKATGATAGTAAPIPPFSIKASSATAPVSALSTNKATNPASLSASQSAPPPPFSLKAPSKATGVTASDSAKATTAAPIPPFSIKAPSATAAASSSSTTTAATTTTTTTTTAAATTTTAAAATTANQATTSTPLFSFPASQTAPPSPFSLKAPSNSIATSSFPAQSNPFLFSFPSSFGAAVAPTFPTTESSSFVAPVAQTVPLSFGAAFASSFKAATADANGSPSTVSNSSSTASPFGNGFPFASTSASTTTAANTIPATSSFPVRSLFTSSSPASEGASTKPLAFSAPLIGEPFSSFEEAFRAYYSRHNPAKISEIPTLLEKYKGKEEVLVSNLASKYNAPFPKYNSSNNNSNNISSNNSFSPTVNSSLFSKSMQPSSGFSPSTNSFLSNASTSNSFGNIAGSLSNNTNVFASSTAATSVFGQSNTSTSSTSTSSSFSFASAATFTNTSTTHTTSNTVINTNVSRNNHSDTFNIERNTSALNFSGSDSEPDSESDD